MYEKIVHVIVIGHYDGIDNNHNNCNNYHWYTIITNANIVIVTSLLTTTYDSIRNKSCSRSEAYFVCSMNHCCKHDIRGSKSHVSTQCWWVANFLYSYFYCRDQSLLQFLNSKFFVVLVYLFFKPGACWPKDGARLVSWNCFCPRCRYVCVCACACACMSACYMCVSAPEAINYIHMILNLYNQLNKFVAFRNITKLSIHGCSLCNEARRDRNQSSKAMLAP